LIAVCSLLCVSCNLSKDERGGATLQESPVVHISQDRSLADGIRVTVSNPYPKRLLCRLAAEAWVEEPKWKDWVVVYPNVGIRETIPKAAVWTNMNPSQIISVVWHTNDTWLKMTITNVRFRAEFRDVNLVPVGDFTTTCYNVKEMLSPRQ